MWDANVIRWRKSSRSDSSGAECVETTSIPANWQKSRHSDSSGGSCVEVADLASAVAVRDSKDPGGPKLVFGAAAWQTFATQAKTGTLDLP